jgi:D-apionolactonase
MSPSLPKRVLYYGKDEPLPERVPLRAGPLSLVYEAGDLRYIKLGGREVIRRIYAAVRDRNWGTISGQLQNVKMDVREDSFRISYDSEHKEHEIHFAWNGEIIGESDGTIRFMFDGEARTTFLKNRIGFCVLHPFRECAGASCRVEYVDGTTKTAIFPRLVAAEQPVKDIHDLKAIAHEVQPGVCAELRFEGDVFEMEDQRNWIDASFKTFCTPLRIPFPAEIKAGTKVRQVVMLKLVQMPDARCQMTDFKIAGESENRASGIVNLEIGKSSVPLPSIGLGASSDRSPEDCPLRARLEALSLAHLRVDLHFDQQCWQTDLARGLREAESIGCPIELALHLSGLPADDLKNLTEAMTQSRSRSSEFEVRARAFCRVLVHTIGEKTTSAHSIMAVRGFVRQFGLPIFELPVGAGTNADFYQLNQFGPPADLCDFICWSMNPQVHAFDNLSLAETPSAIPAQVETARERFRGARVVVSPITLKPRFNPVATGKEAQLLPGELPPQVDPRQMSLFGAGWTLAAFKYLAESGVDRVTFYETIGWRGVIETEAGSPSPGKFPSIPGAVFPLYHVLADIGEFARGEIVVSRSSDPLKVEGLVLRKGDRQRVMLANMTEKPQTAIVKDLETILKLKRLNETNAELAMREPEKFRAEATEALRARDGRIELQLMPYEILTVEG